jgi:transcriptional regulatory protein RtcR
MKRLVVIGLLGTAMDGGHGPDRWTRWRPTVSLFQHDDLLIDRLELIHGGGADRLVEQVSADIARVSPETVVRPHRLPLADPWDFEEVYSALHGFAGGYAFDPEAEDYLVHLTTGTHVAQICMFLLTEARYLPGRLLQASPPRGPRSGPGRYSVIDLDLSKYDRIASRFRAEAAEATSFLKSGIATRNPAFNRMIDQIERVAIRTRSPVLLMGPTGAGKSRLARRIYELKKLRHQVAGDFVEVNCATLRGATAMSALFGHRKGAFTGAQTDRPGLLRAADGGMLFLDEIGELGLDEQAMILRAIEERRFLPIGADREASSDFQLIAGTNRDLLDAVAAGAFREDLFARLNLWTFHLPGLRDRPEDIEPNLDFETARVAETQGVRVAFNREARERFLRFATGPEAIWSGNFRDLSAAVTRMATFAAGGRIGEGEVREEIARLTRLWRPRAAAADDPLADLLSAEEAAAVDPFDRVQLAHVVRACRAAPSLSEAGRALFAASRRRKTSANDADRLRKYLARFGLDWERVRAGA